MNLTLTSYPAKKLSLQILCFLVQTSYLSRGKLWEAGGVRVFTDNLNEKENLPKILETLCVWLSIDKEKVEDALVEGGTMRKLVEVSTVFIIKFINYRYFVGGKRRVFSK